MGIRYTMNPDRGESAEVLSASPRQTGSALPSTQTPHPRSAPAWMMSVLLHIALFVGLLLTLRVVPRGAAVTPDRTAGIVLAKRTADRIEYFDSESEAESDDEASTQSTAEVPLPTRESLTWSADNELPDVGVPQLPRPNKNGLLPDATEFTAGGSSRQRIEKSIQTSVFGVTGTGTKFIYVFDRSGSMGEFNGRPLIAAKTELIASLEELDDIHQFQIIFYNEKPVVFEVVGVTARMWWGNQRGKTLAKRFVRAISAVGGTEHVAALQMALRLKPDVIFFLTDANEPRLSQRELDRLRRINGGSTAIHTIEFGYGIGSSRDNFLKRLAQDNGGQHAYVNIAQLGRGAR